MYYKNINELLKLKIYKDLIIDEINKDFIYLELNKIIEKYSSEELQNRHINIYTFIKYNVSNKISWIDRLKIIVNKLKQDSSSLYSLEIRYGKENALNVFNEKNKKTAITLDYYIKKYGEKEGKIKWKKKNKYNGCSLKNYIKRYGKELGEQKWNKYLNKRSETYKNNKLKGKKYKTGLSLKKFINLYGKKEGNERWNKMKKKTYIKNVYKNSEKYLIKKYGKEEGMKKRKEYLEEKDHNSLSYFIKKYGEEEGNIKYKNHCKKLSYCNSLEYYIKKYGEKGKEKWNERRNKTIFKKNKLSKVSQELFWRIYKKIHYKLRKYCYFGELNHEYFFKTKNTIYFCDFNLKNIIIEFDGEYWHSKLKMIERDKLKNNLYENLNYKVLRISERDYYNDNYNIINKCLNFIKENYDKKWIRKFN